MKVSESQRRWLHHIRDWSDVSIKTMRQATLKKLLALGLAEIYVPPGHERVRITDRGRKYLENWSRAYGAGVTWRG